MGLVALVGLVGLVVNGFGGCCGSGGTDWPGGSVGSGGFGWTDWPGGCGGSSIESMGFDNPKVTVVPPFSLVLFIITFSLCFSVMPCVDSKLLLMQKFERTFAKASWHIMHSTQ